MIQMRRLRQLLWSGVGLSVLIGVSGFALALALFQLTGSGALRTPTVAPGIAHPPESTPLPTPADQSPAGNILAGHLAVAVRLAADSVPLASVRVGAILDVLATLPDGPAGPGLVGPVVTGARVVAVTPASDHADVLLDVSGDDAMLLGGLVRSGLPLTYTVRQGTDQPVEFPVVTLDQTRSRLALAPRTVAASTPAAAFASPPTQQAASQVHFLSYPGVNLQTIEQRFDVTQAALGAANPELDMSAPIVTGTELVVPGLFGFLHPVTAQDTLDSLSQAYNVSADRLRLVNDLPPNLPLAVGVELLIPVSVSP